MAINVRLHPKWRPARSLNARCWLRKAYGKVRSGGSFNGTAIRNSFRLPGIFLSGFRGFYLFAKSTRLFFRTIAHLVLSGKMFRLKCGRLISFLFSGWKDGSVPCFEFELVWKMRLREHRICWFILMEKNLFNRFVTDGKKRNILKSALWHYLYCCYSHLYCFLWFIISMADNLCKETGISLRHQPDECERAWKQLMNNTRWAGEEWFDVFKFFKKDH